MKPISGQTLRIVGSIGRVYPLERAKNRIFFIGVSKKHRSNRLVDERPSNSGPPLV